MSKEYIRERKESKPVVAICYDFDKTLSPDDMQAQGYIQSVGYETDEFWKKSNGLADDNDMDQNLAYMLTMKQSARGKLVLNRKSLMEYGSKVKLYSGVQTWFKRIRAYGEEKGVIVEHYIISSGLKEMIEGTSVGKEFKKIYASSYYYDDAGEAIWPAQVVNYTGKTQYLFRITKGTLDVNDPMVNDIFAPEDLRVPFRNIVYIGDSATDIPCMKLVNSHNGHSIGVYDPQTKDKKRVYQMFEDNRIKYFAAADYADGSELDKLVKTIIDRTVYNEKLETAYYESKKEAEEARVHITTPEEIEKRKLILALETSGNFSTTHSIIAKLKIYSEWSDDEKVELNRIKEVNSQVRLISNDKDIAEFFSVLNA